jgi:hypothetical protein
VRDEPWRVKLSRVGFALRNAGVPRSQHDLALESQGHVTSIFKETE